MSDLGYKACLFVKKIMQLYLVENNYEAMKTVLDKKISCIGSGLDEIWHGFDDACTKLELLSRFDKIDFEIVDDWYESDVLNESDVIVYGEVKLQKTLTNQTVKYSRFRLTAVCYFVENDFKIKHMHFSLPIGGGVADNKSSDSSIREHRRQLADKVQELLDLTNGIKGGVEICTVDEGYTIQYLSNGFKDLINYTEDELKALIGSPHRTLIFENDEDYKKIVDNVNEQLSISDSYAVEYRLLQKGGHYIWVLENGRLIEENGEKRLHCLVVDTHKQKMQELELELSKQKYELAVKATKVQMFEFNIETQDIHMLSGVAQKYGIPKVLKNAGEDIINQGLISPASVKLLKDAFASVTNGDASAECNIAVKVEGEEYTNFSVSMTTGFSAEGHPLFAIGVIKSIQEFVELQQESKLSKTLLENRNLGTFEINVTLDKATVNSSYNNQIQDTSPDYSYSDLLQIFIERWVYPADKEAYYETMNLDRLRSITDFDKTSISAQYRRLDDNSSEYRWWSVSGRLYIDNHTGEVKAFFYEEDINDQKEQEMTLLFDAEHDKMTGFFDKIASEHYIKNFLLEEKSVDNEHAFFIIDLDYFKNINDTFGHVYGDSVLIEASGIIKAEFRNSDIIGRIGGDEFCILMKHIDDIHEITQKAHSLCTKLKKTYSQDGQHVTISASIGISFASKCNYDFVKMYSDADEALYESKKLGRNRFTLFNTI